LSRPSGASSLASITTGATAALVAPRDRGATTQDAEPAASLEGGAGDSRSLPTGHDNDDSRRAPGRACRNEAALNAR
jgi:hypothetical protein